MKTFLKLLMSQFKKITCGSFIILFFIQPPEEVSHYIDPSTGSLVIQVLLGFLAAGAVTVKIFWGRIINWFRKISRHQDKNE